MIIVGLTGSIGSGKSFVGNFLKSKKIPIYHADKEANKILENDNLVKRKIIKLFPNAYINKKINRTKLALIVFKDKKKLKKLESIIHPKVEQSKKKFLSFHKKKKTKLVILEIPILFETKGHKNCNYTILVYVNKKEQFKRVLARKNMSKEKLKVILSNQMSNKKKKKMADFTINNNFTKKKTRGEIKKIMEKMLSTGL